MRVIVQNSLGQNIIDQTLDGQAAGALNDMLRTMERNDFPEPPHYYEDDIKKAKKLLSELLAVSGYLGSIGKGWLDNRG